MPHSSGGSSGGSFHSASSGGGGSSTSTTRTSSRPFPGAFCFVYYDSHHRARTLYTSSADPEKASKVSVRNYVILGIALLIPLAVVLLTGPHNPKKLSSDYSTTINVFDEPDYLSEEDEIALKATFNQFYEVTGICPSILTVPHATWKASHASLQGYAYDAYVKRYKDERHWLLVYAADDASKTNGVFEGMQGNETDGILTVRVTDKFGMYVTDAIAGTSSVAEAFIGGFNLITPTVMDSYFYVEPGVWVFLGIWEGLILVATVSTIVADIRKKNLKNATKVEGEPKLCHCEHCGAAYYEGTTNVCPKCRADVTSPHYAHFE